MIKQGCLGRSVTGRRAFVASCLLVAACSAATSPGRADATGPRPRSASRPPALVAGSLPTHWMHGADDCSKDSSPELEVHAYNATTYIMRQDKCRTFEAPFVYLLLGTRTALLVDTGATRSTAIRDAVRSLVGRRALVVAHSHAHGDHHRGDDSFAGQPATTVVGLSPAAVEAAFGFRTWPTGLATYQLGDRTLDVLAIPGHEPSHIAIYDRQTGLLLTGDTIYPGFLFIDDWAQYRTSISRLARFARTHRISHVLGAHIEMTSTPKVAYPYGTVYQPSEHRLELTADDVLALDAAVRAIGPTLPTEPVAYDHFVITK